jgi:rubrerythrin
LTAEIEEKPAMLVVPSSSPTLLTNRRRLLTRGGQAVVSAAAAALLVGRATKADGSTQTADQMKSDAETLNTALSLEYEGIAAYDVGAQSGLLQPAVLKLAVAFQSDHKKHAEMLAKAIGQLGGTPVHPKTMAEYAFPTAKLKAQTDVLRFAADLEQGAASAYRGTVPILYNRDLAADMAGILGSEAMHWAILRRALNETPPTVAFVA